MAGRAGRVDAGQEQQLDHDEALALAGLAAALGDVEREPPGVVAAGARRLGRGEQLADVIEQAGVGREVRARRAADRLLIDAHQPLDALHPAGDPAAERGHGRALQLVALVLLGGELDGRGARATSSTSAWLTRLDLPEPDTPVTVVKHAERESDVEVVQVVARDARAAAASPSACAACGRGGAASPNR